MNLTSITFTSLEQSIQVLTFDETGAIIDSDEHIVQVKNVAFNLFEEAVFSGLEEFLKDMDIGEETTYDCVETEFFGKHSHYDFTIKKILYEGRPVYALAIQDFGEQYAQMLAFRQERNLAEIHANELSVAHERLNEALTNEKASKRTLQITQSKLVSNEKMASLGQLTAGIAHEINNPTNYIYNGINALEITLAPIFDLQSDLSKIKNMDLNSLALMIEDTRKLFDSIRLGANRTSKIVRGLQLFSRQDEGEFKYINLYENLDVTLMLVESNTSEHITIEKRLDPNPKDLYCNPARLNQVFMNILENAIHAVTKIEEGRILIETKFGNNLVVVSIKDNGIGMSEEVKNHIFEPFYTTKEVGTGTGLGLSISYGIIREHGGSIAVKSKPRKGAEFIIELPLTPGTKVSISK